MAAQKKSVVVIKQESPVEKALVHLLDVAMIAHGKTVRCELCGEEDDRHIEGCPVPALEDWFQR